MLVYLATKETFKADILSNRIEEKILDSFQGALGKSVGDLRARTTAKNHPEATLSFCA